MNADYINKLISGCSACEIYEYARKNENLLSKKEIGKLEDAMIATERPRYIYEFAKNVEGANIPKLTSVIFKAENMHYVYPFIMNILLPNFDKKERKKNKVNGNGTQKIKRR